jgi:RHS repeat-associated protein
MRQLTTFDFDPLGREQLMTVAAEGEAGRRTFTDYWPGGEIRSRRTERPLNQGADDTVERWFRFSDGRLSRLDRKRQGSPDFAKNQNYLYDVNGNRNADERGEYTFNARDQLVRWDKTVGDQVHYTLNGSGAGTSRREGTTTTTYEYLPGGERLSRAVVTQGATSTTTNYSYDQGFGDITSYRVEGAAQPAAEYAYDAFGRLTRSERGAKEEQYSYDGLDRRDTKLADGREFDLSYIGLSEALSQEQQVGGGERRSYDYDSLMERLGTARRTTETQTAAYRAYSKDAAGSVEWLEGANGERVGDPYEYDPYGAQTSTESGLSPEAQANPFRFQGHYYDPDQQAYDMRARAYLPEIGRFLQEDHYEDAAGDSLLETDPITQDRYAFLGGNPVSRIEWDGHYAGTSDQRSNEIQTQGGNVVDREDGRIIAGPQAAPGPDRSGFEQPLGAPQQSGDAPLTDVSSTRDPYSRRGAAAPPPGHSPCRIPTSGPAAGSQLACGPPQDGTLFGLSLQRCLATESDGAGRSYCTGWRGAQRVTPEQYLAPFAAFTGEFAFVSTAIKTGARIAPQAAKTAIGGLRSLGDDAGSSLAQRAPKGRRVADDLVGSACSFSGKTVVLMADGTMKPIRRIKVGDKVIATDPATGERSARAVTHVWIHQDAFATLELGGEDLTTTEDHPFWNATDGDWQRADALDTGDSVLTADGRLVRVGAFEHEKQRGTAYNLTIEGVHTYHVGAAALLVHNTCGPLTGAQSRDALEYLGVDTKRIVGRIKGREPVYRLPDGRAITRDLDGHVKSGAWKVGRRPADLLAKRTRQGTYGLDRDGNLVRVGP